MNCNLPHPNHLPLGDGVRRTSEDRRNPNHPRNGCFGGYSVHIEQVVYLKLDELGTYKCLGTIQFTQI